MKLKGTLEFKDIGPGQWVLKTRSGTVSLFGDIDAALDGRSVEVEGDEVEGMSAGMMGGPSGKAVSVRSVSAT